MNATEKEVIITFLRTVRRHALGQVAACDKLLTALGVAYSGNSEYNKNSASNTAFTETTTPKPDFR